MQTPRVGPRQSARGSVSAVVTVTMFSGAENEWRLGAPIRASVLQHWPEERVDWERAILYALDPDVSDARSRTAARGPRGRVRDAAGGRATFP